MSRVTHLLNKAAEVWRYSAVSDGTIHCSTQQEPLPAVPASPSPMRLSVSLPLNPKRG